MFCRYKLFCKTTDLYYYNSEHIVITTISTCVGEFCNNGKVKVLHKDNIQFSNYKIWIRTIPNTDNMGGKKPTKKMPIGLKYFVLLWPSQTRNMIFISWCLFLESRKSATQKPHMCFISLYRTCCNLSHVMMSLTLGTMLYGIVYVYCVFLLWLFTGVYNISAGHTKKLLHFIVPRTYQKFNAICCSKKKLHVCTVSF